MNKRPTVIIVSDPSQGSVTELEVDSDMDAFVAFIRDQLGCDAVIFKYLEDLKDGEFSVKSLVDEGRVPLVVARQAKYTDDHDLIVRYVRFSLSKALHISVIETWDADCPIAECADQFVSRAKGIHEVIDTLAEALGPKPIPKPAGDAFGLTLPEEVSLLCSRLAAVHRDEDDVMELGPMNESDRVCFQAMRMRLLPSTELKKSFDDVVRRLEPSNEPLAVVSSETYDREIELIADFTEKSKQGFGDALLAFEDALLAATGNRRHGGGILKTEVGQGKNNFGFAIDVLSFEEQIVEGFGLHAMASRCLGDRLELIHNIRVRRGISPQGSEPSWDIMEGVIINDVPGFETPILQLYTGQFRPEDISKIAAHIRGRKRFIPVNGSGKLLG